MSVRLARHIRLHSSRVLRITDVLLGGILAGLAVSILLGQVQPTTVRVTGIAWVGIVCAVLLAVRLLIGLLIWRLTKPIGDAYGSYSKLVDNLPTPVPVLIQRADHIQILGGTLIELVRQTATLEQLAIASSRGVKIEIIMLDPAAEILKVIAAERAESSEETPERALARLIDECEFSIRRLCSYLPQQVVDRSLLLSSAAPHHAFQRYGDCYLLTAYTFAHGGFSPSMSLTRSAANEPLCSGLTKGFEDLWKSRYVRAVGPSRQGALGQ